MTPGSARTRDGTAGPLGHRGVVPRGLEDLPDARHDDSAPAPRRIAGVTIYFDHAATTPLRREVLEAMLPVLTGTFGNPSSAHAVGRRARATLDEARERLAARLHAEPRELVLTSGGTESINLAIKGAAWAGKAMGNRIIVSAVEHKAVLDTCLQLEKFGFEIVLLPVDRTGQVDPDQLDAAINDRTILVSVQLANNEIGTIQPIGDLAARVRGRRGIVFHVDAVQAAPYLDVDPGALGVDLVSLAAHKFEGPRGAGLLWIRRGTALLPQMHGGSQERYRRAGTEDVAAAVGMAVAYDLSCEERATTARHLRSLRARLVETLLADPGIELTGHSRDRLPGLLSVIVRDVEGDAAVQALDLEGVCCSTGSACTTGSLDASHVLTAMGYPEAEARNALRLSLGRITTGTDVDRGADVVVRTLARLRATRKALSPGPIAEEVGA